MTDKPERRSRLRRAEDRKLQQGVAWAFLILWFSGLIGLYVLEKRDIKRIDRASLGACERLNIVRGRANEFELEAYRVFIQVGDNETKLAKKDPRAEDVHERSASQFYEAAGRLRFQPLTNCTQAVAHPLSYRPPTPRPFTRTDLK